MRTKRGLRVEGEASINGDLTRTGRFVRNLLAFVCWRFAAAVNSVTVVCSEQYLELKINRQNGILTSQGPARYTEVKIRMFYFALFSVVYSVTRLSAAE